MSRKIQSQIHAVLAEHFIVASGITSTSPDKCACGVKTLFKRDEKTDEFTDVSVLRARAFATHTTQMLYDVIQRAEENERAIDRIHEFASELERGAPKPQWGGFIAEEIKSRISDIV